MERPQQKSFNVVSPKRKLPAATLVATKTVPRILNHNRPDVVVEGQRRFGRPGAAKRKTGNVGASDDYDVTSAPRPAPETVPVQPFDFNDIEEDEVEIVR